MATHRSDGGARRLGFRLGGGVQRRLGVWRCSAGWGGGAARRTARVSRGVCRWQQFFTATHDVAEFGFFYRFTSLQLKTSRNRELQRGDDVAEFGFFYRFTSLLWRTGAKHRNKPHEATTRTVSTSRPRHHVFVSRSCPEANYKWSPQARHDDETRTTCV